MFTRGETITRIRAGVVLDPYSNEETGLDWDAVIETDIANVALEPRPSSEPVQDARNAVTSGFTLYAWRAVDLTPADKVRMRGVVYDIDGEPADWRNPYSGRLVGTIIQTKAVDG